jgi:prenyltransferase beta subunit
MKRPAALLLLFVGCSAPSPSDGPDAVARYFAGLERPDGGWGWEDEPTGHLTPTYAAVRSLRLIGGEIPRPRERAEFVRTHHPYRGPFAESRRHATEIRAFVWEQIRTLQLLGANPTEFEKEVGSWTMPSTYPTSYEKKGNPLFQQEAMILLCSERLGVGGWQGPLMTEYFDARRRANGSFNNTPASDGSDGHIVNTLRGLEVVRIRGRLNEKKPETIDWLKACQLPDGGFTWQPNAPLANVSSMDSTWAGIGALKLLETEPRDRDAAIAWVLSAWNHDGGFGPRPGRLSDPMSTVRAIESLSSLGALDHLRTAARRPAPAPERLPDGLQPFTIQIQAPGLGSPAEAVELARALKIHLWGAKNTTAAWIARAQEIADRNRVPVTFFVADEEYGTFVSLPGFGGYSHIADLVAPAGVDFGASMKDKDPSWETFRKERIAPLERAGGSMVWQICDNEELSTVLLDDSLERGGYAALSTFHMKQNFVDILPFAMRYRGAIPFVALQDAHGKESWHWTDDLAGFRTIFLAREATWQGWREAMKRDWVVSVRHDETTRFRTRMVGGTAAARDLVRRRMDEWRWWGDKPEEIRRPVVSLVALRPGDPYEVGAPEKGIALRVRTGWSNSQQATLLKPLATFEGLTLDQRAVETRLIEIKDEKGVRLESYRIAEFTGLAPGRHVAEAWAVTIGGARVKSRVEFSVP